MVGMAGDSGVVSAWFFGPSFDVDCHGFGDDTLRNDWTLHQTSRRHRRIWPCAFQIRLYLYTLWFFYFLRRYLLNLMSFIFSLTSSNRILLNQTTRRDTHNCINIMREDKTSVSFLFVCVFVSSYLLKITVIDLKQKIINNKLSEWLLGSTFEHIWQRAILTHHSHNVTNNTSQQQKFWVWFLRAWF